MSGMPSPEALQDLAQATADAVCGVLEGYLPGDVEMAEAEVVPPDSQPLDGVSVPVVAAEAGDSSGGGYVLVTTVAGVRKLAAAMVGSQAHAGGQPLDDAERASFAEATTELLAAVTAATEKAFGEKLTTAPPEVRDVETVGDVLALGQGAQDGIRVSLTLAGEPCRLIHLFPAPQEEPAPAPEPVVEEDPLDVELEAAPAPEPVAFVPAPATPDEIIRGVKLRVCAEIGRATMPVADAVSLPGGGLVELDRAPEEPVDVLVNGRLFATGRLVLVEEEWAVRIEQVLGDVMDLPTPAVAAVERG
jgi:flagellar motor switch protein FliN/FliY